MTPPTEPEPPTQPERVQRSRPSPTRRHRPTPDTAADTPAGHPTPTDVADSGGWDYGDPTCTWLG